MSPTLFSARRTWTVESTSTTVEVAFTDASVDFAEGPGRDPDRLADALDRVADAVGVPVVRMSQVHGRDVAVVSHGDDVPTADVLVTATPGLALMTRAADCVPVVLAAPAAGLVAAVHAGREGVVRGAVPAAVEVMRAEAVTDPGEIRAWIGPHVCGACYEVPAAMRDEVAEVAPATRSQTSWGTSLDLGAGVRAQLDALGVVHETVGGCTYEDESLWSHRRGGAEAGRLAGLVWVAP
ncbi:polyphenol oxidase family protein [Nocardioides daphniae]|uniref:polyphenol oxidase family protein n=1 Tax=Nocardioides daphniae TaxID=402297 RepID=UPI00361F1E81